jgi:Mn-dependent DtxR family transcriptional regulator
VSPFDETVAEPAPPSVPDAPSPKDLASSIYALIRQRHGARLPEIEEELSINRFQAVDALRLLIREGVVTQRDRVYLVQEEASL